MSISSIELTGEDKLLFGGRAIQRFVQSFSDEPITLSMIYYWIEAGYLPVQRLGIKVVGNPATIREALHGQTAREAATHP